MGNIVTFYSYKGGVGRSMALANIALQLSKKHNVLVIDWDLEAPGLENYFSDFHINIDSGLGTDKGLLHLLIDIRNGIDINYRDYISEINTGDYGNPITLIHSGRDSNPDFYSISLQNFNWDDFFSKSKGGYFLEKLRKEWHRDFDFVLIDSRTGLSDASGICTILMPDILIPMFTANFQSLFGIRDTVNYIQHSRQNLDVDRMGLTILPIPSRFGSRIEFKESQEWLTRMADILKECYSDWLPKWIEPRYILEQIKIPQIDYFSFGEKLAVLEHGTNDPEGMGYIFSKISSLLSSDFKDIKGFVGEKYYNDQKKKHEKSKALKKNNSEKFKYDVYLSYPRDAYEWVRELFYPALREYLSDILGYGPHIYVDFHEDNNLSLGSTLMSEIQNSIESSKTVVYIFSQSIRNNSFQTRELQLLNHIQKRRKKKYLFPVYFENQSLKNTESFKFSINDIIPAFLQEYQYFDFRLFNYDETLKSTRLRVEFAQKVENLSSTIAASILDEVEIQKPINSKEPEINQSLNELFTFAEQYNEIRSLINSGPSRTKVMQKIVDDIKSVITDPLSDLSTFMNSSSPGMRLIAISALQKFPDLKHTGWLAKHVGDSEKPFIGFQATVALYVATKHFGESHKSAMIEILESAVKEISKSKYKDPNQVQNLKIAQTLL